MFTQDPRTAKIGQEIFPFELGYLPEFYQKKAVAELDDTPERQAQGLRQIREMIKDDKYLKNVEFEDGFLLLFLRTRKYDVDKAFTQVKSYQHLKRKEPSMFTNFRFESTVKTMTNDIMTVLPWRCQDGCAIILVKVDNWYPEDFPVEEAKRMTVILLMQSLRDPMTQVNGFKVILDMKSNPIRHIRHCTPQNIYLLYHGTQECCPARYKGFHFVNQSLTFKAAWFIVKPFLSDKLKKRMYFHPSFETLLDFFPSAVLPVEYGGELSDYNMTDWLRRAMAMEQLHNIISV